MKHLENAIWEADRHIETLSEAIAEWNGAAIQSVAQLEQDKATLRLLDQLLFRYTKLQDAVGERLIPATLAHLQEPFEAWSMRDRLNRLEKLGYLDALQWMKWREIRNHLSHEYPASEDERFAAIAAAIKAAEELLHLYQQWRKKLGV